MRERIDSLTVVVPTYARPQTLARLLDRLGLQESPGVPWDVLVVDNEDLPGAESVFAKHQEQLPVPARLVREPNKGASNARNRGIAEATGDVIVFLDDDVLPHTDWLREIVAPLLAERSVAVGGRVVLEEGASHPEWLREPLANYLSYDRGDTEHDLADNDFLLTANAAFLTSLLRQVEGMDPILGPQPGPPTFNDDVDLCRRIRSVGATIRYVPAAVVVHDLPSERLRLKYMVRRAYAQGRSDWLLERKRLVHTRYGGLKGIAQAGITDVRRIARNGPWRAPVAVSLMLSVSHTIGFAGAALRHDISRARTTRSTG